MEPCLLGEDSSIVSLHFDITKRMNQIEAFKLGLHLEKAYPIEGEIPKIDDTFVSPRFRITRWSATRRREIHRRAFTKLPGIGKFSTALTEEWSENMRVELDLSLVLQCLVPLIRIVFQVQERHPRLVVEP